MEIKNTYLNNDSFKFYLINDIFNKKMYLFLESISDELDSIIQKIIDKKAIDLDYNTIKEAYNLDKGITSILKNKDASIFINSLRYLSVNDLKHYFFTITDIHPNDQYFWIKNTNLDKSKKYLLSKLLETTMSFQNFEEGLGHEFKNEIGNRYINGDFTKLSHKDILDVGYDYSFERHDTSNNIIKHYSVLNNTLYFADYKSFLDSTTLNKDDIKFIKTHYFPLANEKIRNDNLEEEEKGDLKNQYLEIFKQLNKQINNYSRLNVTNNNDKVNNIEFLEYSLNNVIMYNYPSDELNIDLDLIYNTFSISKKIPFLKFRNSIKYEFFRIHKKSIFDYEKNNQNKQVNDFKNYKNYFNKYIENQSNSLITRKHFENWKFNWTLPNEKVLIDDDLSKDFLVFKIDLITSRERAPYPE